MNGVTIKIEDRYFQKVSYAKRTVERQGSMPYQTR